MDIRDDGGLAILYLRRLSELERRVAELEEQVRLSRRDGRALNGDSPRDEGWAAAVEADSPPEGPSGVQLEGARMVVIEMLSSGYEQAQIATYLSETFGVEDGEALVEEASAVRG